MIRVEVARRAVENPPDYSIESWGKAMARIEERGYRAEVVRTADAYRLGTNAPETDLLYEISYEGAVIATREENGYNDSDFYAVVWDEGAGAVRRVGYATTRGWTYNNSANVDATEEVIEKATAFIGNMVFNRRVSGYKREAGDMPTPERGNEVFVFKGRKVPIGTEGRVFWTGEGRWGLRIGIETAEAERIFVAAANVFVIGATSELLTDEALEGWRETAMTYARGGDIGGVYAAMTSPAGIMAVL